MVLKIPEIKHMVSLVLKKQLMSRRCKFVVKKKKDDKIHYLCIFYFSDEIFVFT